MALLLACGQKSKPEDPATEGGSASSSSESTSNGQGTVGTSTNGHSTSLTPTGTVCEEDECSAGSSSASSSGSESEGPGKQDMAWSTCDTWVQDCPVGQKCAPYASDGAVFWNATRCVPVAENPAQIGEPCMVQDNPATGKDNCDVGMLCWEGDQEGQGEFFCTALCGGTPEEPTCPPGAVCSTFSEWLAVCEVPACDPLLQDCPHPDDVCIPNIYLFDDWCLPDESGEGGQIHGACDVENACDKGLVCIPSHNAAECDQEPWGCCQPFCEVDVELCPGVGQECLPYFANSDAGVCQKP